MKPSSRPRTVRAIAVLRRTWPAALLGVAVLATGVLVWRWLRHGHSPWCVGAGLLATVSAAGAASGLRGRRSSPPLAPPAGTDLSDGGRRLECMIDDDAAAYFRVDRDGRYRYVNAAWLRMHGYDRPEEVLGRPWWLTCPEPDRPARRQRFDDLLAGRPVRADEARHTCRDGRIGYHSCSAHAVVRDGEMVGIEGFLIDTTALRLARQQRRASEERSAAVLAALQEGVVLIDRQWNVTFVNPAAERQFGPVAGQRCYEYIHGRDAPCPDCAFAAVALGDPVRHERFSRRSGKHYEVCAAPLRGPDGQVEKVVILHDVTARKQMEWKLRRSIRDKENLLRELHHRVKNNLQVISSILSLQTAHLADASAESILRECRARVRAIGTLHDKLYGADDLARVRFDRYVRSLAADLLQSFGVTGQTVELAVTVDGPPLPMDRAVPCGLIVNELLSNALKHAFEPGAKGRIEVALRRDPAGRRTLTVADNGRGMPEGVELDGAESLGLQLVSALVDQLGGRCEIRRAAGTEFRISFGEDTSDAGGAWDAEGENPGRRRRADRRQGHSEPVAKDAVCRARHGRQRS